MEQEIKTKKSKWENLSPKLMFIFGLTTGIAIFAVLSLIYSFLALTRVSVPSKTVVTNTNNQEIVKEEQPVIQNENNEPGGVSVGSFIDTNKPICKKNGKPIIRLFSTSWCPHCLWIKETFDKVANDYVKKGKIVAYHWDFDSGDNLLTKEMENKVPEEEEAIYREFNPRGSIPTFIFGCRYYRIGNAYEREGDAGKIKEEKEFRDLIEKLLKES